MRKLMFLCILMILCGCFDAPRVPVPDGANPFDHVGEWSNGFDALFFWSNAVSLLMFAVCVGVIIWAPVPGLKSWAWVGLTVAATLLISSMVFAVVKPFIPWIVLGALGIGLLIGLWFIISNFHLLKKIIHLDKAEYKENLTPQEQKIVEACPAPTIKQ